MENRITEFGGGSVVIGRGLINRVSEFADLNRKVLIVTDDGVPEEYAEKVSPQCKDPITVTIPQGEQSKTMESLKMLISNMLKHNMTREDCVVAVGGGVVGDLSGFAASVYMRGIDFYNIPTTLLAQIDSSIGGKTAVDFEGVKNAVGTFWPAKRVITDPDLLLTLDTRQVSAGLAEAVKIAAVRDRELFELFEKTEDIREIMPEIIRRAALNKIEVVTEDPGEKGLRRILNFGHTIGHGIESFYEGRLLHGECVALGMLPMSSESVRTRLKAIYKKTGLPARADFSRKDIEKFVVHDKKASGDKIKAVIVNEPGTFEIREMTADEILARSEMI